MLRQLRDLVKDKQMVILADSVFHGKEGDPENMKIWKKGQWNDRFIIESVFSQMSIFMNLKHLSERSKKYFEATLAYVSAAFNLVLGLFGSFANLSL
ncbi:MAG: hypothetical protein SFU25_08585 [Candidatus Caenarcaniphilales bacterium]|nr:hypothetical protein [Candidatus Caenarcaniphilales bacterium]